MTQIGCRYEGLWCYVEGVSGHLMEKTESRVKKTEIIKG